MTEPYSALKAAWHVPEILALRRGEQIVPVEIQLILSDYCNQDCYFCAYRASTGLSQAEFIETGPAGERIHNPKRRIPTLKAEEIIRDASDLGVKSIIFTGGGEPTAHPDYLHLFRLALDAGLDCSLNTNGLVFHEGWDRILPRFAYVRFSVDASSPVEYALVRNVPAYQYDRVLQHIRQLREAVDDQKSPCMVGAGYVVSKDSRNLRQGLTALRDAGCHYVRLACLQSTEGKAAYGDAWDQMRMVAQMETEAMNTPTFQVINLFEDRLSVQPDYQFCGMQQFVLYIGGNLKTYRCCYTAYTKHGETGDLRYQSLKAWLASEQKRLLYGNFDARSCSDCALNDKNRVINYMLDSRPTHVNFV